MTRRSEESVSRDTLSLFFEPHLHKDAHRRTDEDQSTRSITRLSEDYERTWVLHRPRTSKQFLPFITRFASNLRNKVVRVCKTFTLSATNSRQALRSYTHTQLLTACGKPCATGISERSGKKSSIRLGKHFKQKVLSFRQSFFLCVLLERARQLEHRQG